MCEYRNPNCIRARLNTPLVLRSLLHSATGRYRRTIIRLINQSGAAGYHVERISSSNWNERARGISGWYLAWCNNCFHWLIVFLNFRITHTFSHKQSLLLAVHQARARLLISLNLLESAAYLLPGRLSVNTEPLRAEWLQDDYRTATILSCSSVGLI